MTSQEAVNILDQVSSSVQLTRAQHVQVQEAVDVLTELINKQDKGKSKG